jgi:uncharacterized protein (TIGR02996 family)
VSLRQALEDALLESPDDLATHRAYADFLCEQGDPRGELISVQLSLEDPALRAEERQRLHGRELELFQAHERDWLGRLAPALFEENISDGRRQHNKISRARWVRGWLDDLYLWRLDLPAARALARCPVARLLSRLHIDLSNYADDYQAEPDDEIPEGSEYPFLYPLLRAPFLPNLRVFQLGETVDFREECYNCRTSGEGVVALIEQMPRLEELYLLAHQVDLHNLFALRALPRLRTLQVYHVHEAYPLEVLTGNPALGALTTLRLHPAHSHPPWGASLRRAQVLALLRSPHLPALTHLHLHASDLGDEGVQGVIDSGILKRLRVLDLGHGCITDEGARLLAACPDVKKLELLDLSRNELSEEGAEWLEGLGLPVRCEDQQEDPGEEQYLYSGDME